MSVNTYKSDAQKHTYEDRSAYLQASFSSGMDMLSKDIDIDAAGYKLAFNARNRFGVMDTIPQSKDITYNLKGKPQGIYGVGNIYITFYSGRAYYQIVGAASWRKVPNLALDSSVDTIYIAMVPGATNNFLRSAVTTNGVVDASAGVVKGAGTLSITGSPAGVICQDGINQPWFITYDTENDIATARILGTYDQWDNTGTTANNREYVPIMKQMLYHPQGILFGVSADGFNIFRSVSGRPLDFMINIDQNGNKLATESLGGALSVSFAVDFNEVTCLSIDSTAALIIGNQFLIYGMALDYTNTIFGEPQFDRQYTIQSGIVNNSSVSDKNGDTAFIDSDGMKTFNGVTQYRFKGQEDPFYKMVASLFVTKINGQISRLVQNNCAVTNFDGYLIFSVLTKYGNVFLVYDNLNSIWVSVDLNATTTSGITMFAQVYTPLEIFCACQTLDGKVYLLYKDVNNNRETGTLFSRAFVTGSLFYEHKTNTLKVAIQSGEEDGTVIATEYIDDRRKQLASPKSVTGVISGLKFPLRFPMIFDTETQAQTLTFNFDRGDLGLKMAFVLVWTGDHKLIGFQPDITDTFTPTSQKQTTKTYA